MSAAAARNVGLRRATRSSIDTIELCTARLIAATATASRLRIGAAIERSPYASSSLLIAKPSSRTCFSSSRNAARDVSVFGPRRAKSIRASVAFCSASSQEREHHLPERGAVGREARADMEIEVDLALARPRAAAPLDVHDVEAVEDRHVHGVAGCVAQLPQMRRGDLAQLHRVDRGEPEVEHARAEAVLLRRRILLEIAEGGQRRHVAVGRRAAEPDVAAELAHAEKRSSRAKGR